MTLVNGEQQRGGKRIPVELKSLARLFLIHPGAFPVKISINKTAAFFVGAKNAHPTTIRIVTNLMLWMITGEIFTFAKLYSLPLGLEVDWKAPILLLGAAMVVVFTINCVKRKARDLDSTKSCDEIIDFVIDEVSSSVLNVGGICAALVVNTRIEGSTDFKLMLVAIGCYALFLLMEKRSEKVLENPSHAQLHDVK